VSSQSRRQQAGKLEDAVEYELTRSTGLATKELSPEAIRDWEYRIGIERGSTRAPIPQRFRGATGLSAYGRHVAIDVDDPAGFDSIVYARRLSSIGTFCSLDTPRRVERTESLIQDRPSDNLLVAIHTLPGRTTLQKGGRRFACRPGQLMTISNATTYVQRTEAVSDPTGIVIPLSLMGPERVVHELAQRSAVSDTLLSRATAAFIYQFATDTIAGGTEPRPDTETSAVELVRACLGQVDAESRPLTDNELFVRHAAIELIERNHRDPGLTPATIARTLHVSRRHLYRHFEATDESVATLIADRRLQTAHELLTTDNTLAITEVAAAAGFPSVATMRNRFRARYGVNPIELRSKGELQASTAS
jgi:AraC family transcriptional regulator, positive regulator of tynA and feaB